MVIECLRSSFISLLGDKGLAANMSSVGHAKGDHHDDADSSGNRADQEDQHALHQRALRPVQVDTDEAGGRASDGQAHDQKPDVCTVPVIATRDAIETKVTASIGFAGDKVTGRTLAIGESSTLRISRSTSQMARSGRYAWINRPRRHRSSKNPTMAPCDPELCCDPQRNI